MRKHCSIQLDDDQSNLEKISETARLSALKSHVTSPLRSRHPKMPPEIPSSLCSSSEPIFNRTPYLPFATNSSHPRYLHFDCSPCWVSAMLLKRAIATAPHASRALPTTIRPVVTLPVRLAAAGSRTPRRHYHEKDMFLCLLSLGPHPYHLSASFRHPQSLNLHLLPLSENAQLTPGLLLDHYSSPRNVGSMSKEATDVGTGLVGAPACGDVMKLQIKVDPSSNTISDVKFKTFGCGSAIASSSYLTELVRGMTLEDAGRVKNTEIARELCLPPVKCEFGTFHEL